MAMNPIRAVFASIALLAFSAAVSDAAAQTDPSDRLARLEALIEEQERRLDEQARQIEEQRKLLAAQSESLVRLGSVAPETLEIVRGRGAQDGAANSNVPSSVGVAPEESPQPTQLAALPDFASVLTPRGEVVLEPSSEASLTSDNRLVFRGVEIVPGLQIGVIEASDADRESAVATLAVRTGITDRIEFEARVPYLWRTDRVTTVQQREDQVTRTTSTSDDGLGDIEASLRYQFTRAAPRRPILIGNLRVKSDSGSGPFDIGRDEFGIATGLATGSGFWGVEPGMTVLYPSDPVVLFANAAYMFNLERDVNQTVGQGTANEVLIGRVDPGDSITASLGFGFSINPEFSFSLGYRHNYLMSTETELNETMQRSDELQLGALLFGISYRTSDTSALSANFEFGVTEDAPDARLVVRSPFSF